MRRAVRAGEQASIPASSPESRSPADNGRFVTLDALRGVAALAVGIGHATPGFKNAIMAVDFFFMLSGFVLAHAYAERLAAGMPFSVYMTTRLVRLLPMVLLGTLLGALTATSYAGLAGALLVPLPGPVLYPLDPPSWSLFYELLASALLGLHLWLRSDRVDGAMLLVSAAGVIATVLHLGSIDYGLSLDTFVYGLSRVLFGFTVGVLLYKWRPRLTAPPLLLVVALLCALMLPLLHSPAYQLLFLFLLSPALIAAGSNAASFRGAELMGALSYPFYIVHWPVFLLLDGFDGVVKIEAALVVAYTVLKLYDEPARRALRQRLAHPRRRRLG